MAAAIAISASASCFFSSFLGSPTVRYNAQQRGYRMRANPLNEEDYYVDAEEMVGDGFAFAGGKYAEGTNNSDEWFSKGRMVKAHPVYGNKGKAKDPLFGLTMGSGSQSSGDLFRWFCVETGSSSSDHSIMLIHGFPSQAYSFRKAMPILSEKYHTVAFDWIGFGFSDKPQPKYGFDYTLDEYTEAFKSLVDALPLNKTTLVVQLIDAHAKLPSTLALFSNFLLGEIFCQDPLRASDKAITSCGPYKMKEEDAMVYRRPYLTSGSSGFALNAISKAMKKDLRAYVEAMRKTLSNDKWKIPTTICWGLRDRWLSFDGVENFCRSSKLKLVELPTAGHHAQEDSGEELGKLISEFVGRQ